MRCVRKERKSLVKLNTTFRVSQSAFIYSMSAILGVTSPTNSYVRLKLLVSQELEFLWSQDRGQDRHGVAQALDIIEGRMITKSVMEA